MYIIVKKMHISTEPIMQRVFLFMFSTLYFDVLFPSIDNQCSQELLAEVNSPCNSGDVIVSAQNMSSAAKSFHCINQYCFHKKNDLLFSHFKQHQSDMNAKQTVFVYQLIKKIK